MTVINTNVSASVASNAIARNEREMNTAMERLSTGKRVNSAADDAAGLAISSRMSSQVKGLEQAARNTADGISMVQTIEGAAKEIISILTRMKELAVQSNSGTYSATDRAALDLEFSQLRSELHRIAENTEFNGYKLLNNFASGTSAAHNRFATYQVGAGSGQTLQVEYNVLYSHAYSKSTATSATAADGSNPHKHDVTIVRTNVAATDKLAFTIVDSAGNEVDVLLNLDATAVTALAGGSGVHALDQAGDINFIGGGRTALNTVLNGVSGGGGITVKLGADKADSAGANKIQIYGTANNITFTIKDAASGGVRFVRGEVAELDAYGVDTASDANSSMAKLDSIISTVSEGRAKYGAFINRLEHASDNLTNVAQNTDSSRSRIEDTDYAGETSELARTQIISQAATAMLAHANQAKQTVLALLQ